MRHTDISLSQRRLITFTVMLVTILEVLDSTIVNVSLPSMMGTLGANSDQITWILTSYIVASAIVMPLTGFLVDRIGRQRLLLINIAGFMMASILCGVASNLAMMVTFRTLQGLFGASLIPLSQYILRDSYPPEEHGKAMAIWGIGVMVAPVAGPTLGGYITEYLSWHWVFYINVPVCLLALMLTLREIPESVRSKKPIDKIGIALLFLTVGCLQVFLDRGNTVDWFNAHSTQVLCYLWVSGLILFLVRSHNNPTPVITLSLFRNRNFSLATLSLTVFCLCIFSVVTIQPIMLERIMGYTTSLTGLLMAPRGIASAIGMIYVGVRGNQHNPKYVIFAGCLLAFLGTYWMSLFNAETPQSIIILSGCLQGFGMGLFFVPITTTAFSNLKEEEQAEASGLYSFFRNLSVSIGISLASTIITREGQINWSSLGEHISVTNPNLQLWLQHLGWNLHNPISIRMLASQLAIQSQTIAFIDLFRFMAILFLLILLFVMLLKSPSKEERENASMMAH